MSPPIAAITDYGTLLSGLAALITALWAIAMFTFSRLAKKRTQQFLDATTAAMSVFIAERMKLMIADRDPKSYYTMDLNFPDGNSIVVPMIPGVPVRVLENVDVTVLHHGVNETILSLVCDGFGHIGPHSHERTCERIEVKRGVVTDLQTGHIYRAGDVWEIPAGESHGATFQDVVALLYHKPPLPTAYERPVNLDAVEKIYHSTLRPSNLQPA